MYISIPIYNYTIGRQESNYGGLRELINRQRFFSPFCVFLFLHFVYLVVITFSYEIDLNIYEIQIQRSVISYKEACIKSALLWYFLII